MRHDDGRLLVERAVATLRAAGCGPIVVVLGAESARVRSEAQLGDASLVDNPGWKTGMGSSLRVGLGALADTDAEGATVLLVDTPGIGPEAVSRVMDAFDGKGALLAATYKGRRGHPVLLGRDHWAGVIETALGDQGARTYLASRDVALVECGDLASGLDVDSRP